jgi:adenosylhomocysteine nucleosidase
MKSPSVLIVTPMASEYAAVRAGVRPLLEGGALELRMCGIGPERARAFCRGLEDGADWSCLALLGWAGGLATDLRAGDAILADVALAPDASSLPCRAMALAGVQVGPMLTVAEALYTPAAKRGARETGALAVEMEAYPLAAWAAAHGLPFVHARVILDSVEDPLPDLGGALDAFGRPRLPYLVRRVIQRPALIPELWRFSRHMRALSPRLGALARDVVQACCQPAPT